MKPIAKFIILVEGNRPGYQTRLFQVSLLARVLNELALTGAEEALVIPDSEADLDPSSLGKETLSRIKVEIRSAPASESPLSYALSLAANQPGETVVLPSDRLFSNDFLRRVQALPVDEKQAQKIAASSSPDDREGAVLRVSQSVAGSLLKNASFDRGGLPGRDLVIDGFSSPIATKEQLREARRFLLYSLRKSIDSDGVVAYYLMRPLTLRITRLLAHTPLQPNHLTLISFLIGLAGVALVAFGSRWPATLGASFFFIAATTDCLDGEIARLRYKMSYSGAWLDTITDDIQTVLFIGASAMYLSHSGQPEIWPIVAGAAILLFALPQVYVYHQIHTRYHSADPVDFKYAWENGAAPSGQRTPFSFLKYVGKRDFYTLLFSLLFLANLVPALLLACFTVAASRAVGVAVHLYLARRRQACDRVPEC
jgi:phosphatidylglycerophosphate synthase